MSINDAAPDSRPPPQPRGVCTPGRVGLAPIIWFSAPSQLLERRKNVPVAPERELMLSEIRKNYTGRYVRKKRNVFNRSMPIRKSQTENPTSPGQPHHGPEQMQKRRTKATALTLLSTSLFLPRTITRKRSSRERKMKAKIPQQLSDVLYGRASLCYPHVVGGNALSLFFCCDLP